MAAAAGRVKLREAIDPLVLAVDIGSTASRGDVYDAAGRPVQGGREKVPHHFTTRDDGTSEIDPDQIVGEVQQIITALATDRRAGRIGGVALDTFASSLVGVGADRRARTPCFTYADSRCAAQVGELRRELDERVIQQRTGCRLHASYLTARLRWLRDTTPDTFRSVRHWMSLGEHIYLQILGMTAAGTSTAAWTGMLDRRTGQWDQELLDLCEVREEQLSEVRDPDQPITEVDAAVRRRWPALAGAAWFPVVSDGFSSNMGAGAVDQSAVAASVATSGAMRVLVHSSPDEIPSGLWCYRLDGSRSLLGGAVNDVGRVVTWLQSTVRFQPEDDFNLILAAAPQASTPLVLPYFSGERSTGWAANTRALFAGVSAATTGAMLFRGAMEGVAISYARIAEQLQSVAGQPQRILASGRVTQDLPAWLQILADVLEAPVIPVTIKRSTLRGTALIALDVLAPDVARTASATGEIRQPVADRAALYRARKQEYQALYEAAIAPAGVEPRPQSGIVGPASSPLRAATSGK
jgi:gluconokinase